PALAETPPGEAFVADNIVATLYHEIGHAVIDRKRLPIFGQEEDAADVFAIVLMNEMYDEFGATSMASSTAFGFLFDAEALRADGGEPDYSDVHGPDLQRFYNLVCLFYGARPKQREGFARDFGLPGARREGCEEEYLLAFDSWVQVLEELSQQAHQSSFVLVADDEQEPVALVVADELGFLNDRFGLEKPIEVRIEFCEEADAYYDPSTQNITICTGLADYLASVAPLQ
ncbi:MAG: DUF4344 domain-containing metallopeptidase, partial [Paracoccaceae bacterium]